MIPHGTKESFKVDGRRVVIFHQPNCTALVVPYGPRGVLSALGRFVRRTARPNDGHALFAFFGVELDEFIEPPGTDGEVFGRWGCGRYTFGVEIGWETHPLSEDEWFSAFQQPRPVATDQQQEPLPAPFAPTCDRVAERFRIGSTMHQRIYIRIENANIVMHIAVPNPLEQDFTNFDTVAQAIVVERL